MADFAQWRASVISQINFMLTDSDDPSLGTTFFERHRKISETFWAKNEEALSVAIQIVNAEHELAEILQQEAKERFLRDNPEASFWEREVEFVEHWKQDCLDNDII
jgi:hypothetical protein